MSLCLPLCQLFKIHGNKLKPHPFGNLGQASVKCIAYTVLSFRIRKNSFNGYFAFSIKVLIFGVISQLLIVLPDMAQDRLYTVFRGITTASNT